MARKRERHAIHKLRKKMVVKRLFLWGVSWSLTFVVTLFTVELSVIVLLNNSSLLPAELLLPFRNYYLSKDREIVQYLPDCSRYDQGLSYTLKPGECRFVNREFDVEYHINSIGVRDDEASLDAPEIIVIGDSQAMGWGVSQGETFASVLEEQKGRKVLNAAISSYGTVRELKLLENVNMEKLEYLIVQYCDNDQIENKAYRDNGNVLQIMSEEMYKELVRSHVDSSAYYFGKHSVGLVALAFNSVKRLVRGAFSEPSEMPSNIAKHSEEVDIFLNALMSSTINLDKIKVIVLEINSHAKNDSLFIDRLNREVASMASTNGYLKNIIGLDVSPWLTSDKYFTLDDHLTARGHQDIAHVLVELLKQLDRESLRGSR